MLKHFLTVLAVLAVATTSWAERVDMIKAGAKIDGKTINTKLINQTIERLNKLYSSPREPISPDRFT